MMITEQRSQIGSDDDPLLSDVDTDEGLTLDEFTGYFQEILDQPAWRTQADKEMDYKDGNQLDSELLRKMEQLGVPPAIEPLIGPAIESILGAEAKKRTDWRVIPDGDKEGQEVADAFNYKLNQAERKSRADRSCSDAYESQVSVGIGWVEVSREEDPFKYPYRCCFVHRNEIWWDWTAKESMLQDARYLIRSRWIDKKVGKLMFPDKAELIEQAVSGWYGFDAYQLDGGKSTELAMSAHIERGWSIEEQEWRNREHNRIRLFEVWTRRWERVLVLKMPNGRIVELNPDDDMHMMAVASGVKPVHAVVSRVSRSYWAGPHKLVEEPSPYLHSHFPYVPFWGHREDRTGIPFGRIRGMMFMQDNVNASISKIRWGLASVRTTRTDGAVIDDDETFHNEIARIDADIVLDQKHMAMPGAVFKVERDFQLNEQQYKMLNDARAAIERVGGIANEFQGQKGNATSGVQYNSQIEQTQQTLANIDDNFQESRAQVGELLLSMIIQNMQGMQEDVLIEGKAIRDDRVVSLNVPTVDDDGLKYLTNDVSKTMLKVVLADVPSTPAFRVQQLTTFGEAYKSAPEDYQQIMFPHMMNLMDIPDKDEIIKAIKERDANAENTPERRLIALQVDEMMAKIGKLKAETTVRNVEGQYSSVQAAQTIAALPGVVPIADELLKSAGYVDANGSPIATQPMEAAQLPTSYNEQRRININQQPVNTDPRFPSNPESPSRGMMQGIETQAPDGVIQQ